MLTARSADDSSGRMAAGPTASGVHLPAGMPMAQPPASAGGVRASAADGPVRQFCLTVDVRSFQASRRLPVSLASAFVQVRTNTP